MRTAPLAWLALGVFSSCEPLRQKVYNPWIDDPSFALEHLIQKKQLCLREDPVRFQALHEFYEQSLGLDKALPDPWQHTVILRWFSESPHGTPERSYAHGYLMDDCGLVLASYHFVSTWGARRKPLTVVDRNGEEYPALPSDFQLPTSDFAVVVADTGKQPSSHPLKFVPSQPSPGTPLQFQVYHPYSYLSQQISAPLLVEPLVKGAVLDELSFLERRGHAQYTDNSHGQSEASSVSDELRYLRERNFFYLSELIYGGNSGTPLFDNEQAFLGIVWGYWRKEPAPEESVHASCGIGIATPAASFFSSLENYLYGAERATSAKGKL